MNGGLSRDGLKDLETQIENQLNGRNPKSLELEQSLQNLIGDYSYQVEYHNTVQEDSYQNKYGAHTPIQYRASLSIANFMANGIPVEDTNSVIPQDEHHVTAESMGTFIKSFAALLAGHPSRKDIGEVLSYDPNPEVRNVANKLR